MTAQEYIEAWDLRWENHFKYVFLYEELSDLHGIDVVAQMESVLVAEMNKEVDKHIKNDIQRLFNISIQQAEHLTEKINDLANGDI